MGTIVSGCERVTFQFFFFTFFHIFFISFVFISPLSPSNKDNGVRDERPHQLYPSSRRRPCVLFSIQRRRPPCLCQHSQDAADFCRRRRGFIWRHFTLLHGFLSAIHVGQM